MKILIACEFSGIIREAFAVRGHESYSCDFQDTLIPSKNHLQCNVLDILGNGWDLMIAHPPCTYLTYAGERWFYHPDDKHLRTNKRRPHPRFPNRRQQRIDAINFFKSLYNANIEKICIENPKGVVSRDLVKETQIIQPFAFGENHSKETYLWLKNLPLLTPTKFINPQLIITRNNKITSKFHYDTFIKYRNNKDRSNARSITFQGIANAMAEQWG